MQCGAISFITTNEWGATDTVWLAVNRSINPLFEKRVRMGLSLHPRTPSCIIHQQPEGAPECFEEELLMLVGGWGLLRITV